MYFWECMPYLTTPSWRRCVLPAPHPIQVFIYWNLAQSFMLRLCPSHPSSILTLWGGNIPSLQNFDNYLISLDSEKIVGINFFLIKKWNVVIPLQCFHDLQGLYILSKSTYIRGGRVYAPLLPSLVVSYETPKPYMILNWLFEILFVHTFWYSTKKGKSLVY